MVFILNRICEMYPEETFLKADGFDSAIIGVDESSMRLIYSVHQCIKTLMVKDKMSLEAAKEFFEFNVRGAYMGEKTPIWCWDLYV